MTHYALGQTKNGEAVTAYCLENRNGATATILDYGCAVQSLRVPNAQGGLTDVVLGYDTVSEYETDNAFLGVVAGRVANRIGNSEFTLNGKTYRLARNDGENHLHGGIKGFDKYVWKADAKENALVLSRVSPDGEENYPGSLDVKVTYELTDDNALRILYDASTDQDTIVNLTNHSYFNLNGAGSVLDHNLQIFAENYTENDASCLPTGRLLNVSGTAFDFREPKQLGRDIDADDTQLRYGYGYDHNFVLSDGKGDMGLKKAAVLYSRETGIRMTASTTLPGIQLYTGNHLTPRKGKNGSLIDRRCAVCLETQVWPNAIAYPHFPSPILRAGAPYHTETVYHFDILRD